MKHRYDAVRGLPETESARKMAVENKFNRDDTTLDSNKMNIADEKELKSELVLTQAQLATLKTQY